MSNGVIRSIAVGCAGWSIPKQHAALFPAEGTHLARYAQRLPAVEINSCFYRSHRPATYAKWANETPDDFRFSVKIPKEITHVRRLKDAAEPLGQFLMETSSLGAKRGPLLIQLPPSLRFSMTVADAFFSLLRERYDGPAACEPRHRTWFSNEADQLLRERCVARVAADPAVVPGAAREGGWPGLVYVRWHGSPTMYYSSYDPAQIDLLAKQVQAMKNVDDVWCIFDNTALGAASHDALTLLRRLDLVSNQ